MLDVAPEQALAFRIAGNHLHRRTDALTAIAACGLQEYPPGWSGVALHARSSEPLPSKGLVTVNAMRGAPYVVRREDRAIFTRALVPADEHLAALIGRAVAKELDAAGIAPRDALDRVAAAARDGLADGPLERDDFHQALRERLPDELLPWCRGCESHHVRPGLWRALGPEGVTEMPAKATWKLAPKPKGSVEAARAELARRFLSVFGPATHTHLASWAGTAPQHAKALFAAIEDELEPVKVDRRKMFACSRDLKRLEKPPKAKGVRLLGGHDAYVAQPDRDTLVPDAKLRKQLFPAVGRPGVVLVDGELRGLWRGRKAKDVLEITVDWVGPEADISREAKAVARLRGCESVRTG